tara:strand:+ start:177 stop:491 length:315 start_codon:yes stop_codon:yes gene_type:complete
MSEIIGLLGIPGMIIGFITIISFLVMIPSAFATWYSRCLNIKLRYGFLIAFSSIILGILLFNLDLPFGVKKIIFLVYNIIMSIIMIYGVFRQFKGRCSLGGGNL